MSETVAEVILGVFGENPALNIAFWSSSILIAVTVYAFFFKETTAAYQEYYAYKLEKSAEAAMVAAQIANVQDVKVLRKALAWFDELYSGGCRWPGGRLSAALTAAIAGLLAGL